MTAERKLRIASALSTSPTAGSAVDEVVDRLVSSLDGVAPDLVVVFCSPHHLAGAGHIAERLTEGLVPQHLVGCTGESIVGEGREVEGEPALSVWAAVMPGVGLESFHSSLVRTPEGAGFTGIPDLGEAGDAAAVLMLADPFSYPAHGLLGAVSQRFGGLPFVGGMASGGQRAGEHRLFRGIEVHDQGAVGVVLSGEGVRLRTIVSQGCRPIGESYVVTRAEGNVIYELGGVPALERAQRALAEAEPRDRELASQGLHIGIVIDEQKEDFGRGDFLVRGVVGADQEQGSLVVGDEVEVGRTVQLHVRDADSADEDLRLLLRELNDPPAAGLLFTCNGRGTRMFHEPDHDVRAIQEAVGTIPVAGFFCAGEIGPVGGRNFLHGFTASVALFG